MSNLKNQFKKQGGFNLIKQYIKNHCLFTAINQFVVLGKNRVALEILRLSVQLKTKKRLEKKYKKKLLHFEEEYDSNVKHEISNKIWICWLQGIENAPHIVKKCYDSIKKNFPNKEIIIITEKNIFTYVSFPKFILEKYKKGIITRTHLTDLLRTELLLKYGGMWLDATVLCTMNESKIPDYYFNSDLFLYQELKPGRDGHSTYISSWLISAKTNNKILSATRYLCYEYWKKNNYLLDYFLFHNFLSICLEYYREDWKNIIPVTNSEPHILLLRLFDEYNDDIYNYLIDEIPFHKLTYKFSEEETQKENTFYKKFF